MPGEPGCSSGDSSDTGREMDGQCTSISHLLLVAHQAAACCPEHAQTPNPMMGICTPGATSMVSVADLDMMALVEVRGVLCRMRLLRVCSSCDVVAVSAQ